MKYSMYVKDDQIDNILAGKKLALFESYGQNNGTVAKLVIRHCLDMKDNEKLKSSKIVESLLWMEYEAYEKEHGTEAVQKDSFDGIHLGVFERRSDNGDIHKPAVNHVIYLASVENRHGKPRFLYHCDEPREDMEVYRPRKNEFAKAVEETYFVEYRNSETCRVCGGAFCLDRYLDMRDSRCPHCGQLFDIDFYYT